MHTHLYKSFFANKARLVKQYNRNGHRGGKFMKTTTPDCNVHFNALNALFIGKTATAEPKNREQRTYMQVKLHIEEKYCKCARICKE